MSGLDYNNTSSLVLCTASYLSCSAERHWVTMDSLFLEIWHCSREQNTLEKAVVCGGAGSRGRLFPYTKRGLTGDPALHLCFFWHEFSLASQGAKYCLCGKQRRLNSFSSQVAATLLPYLLREKAKNIIVRFNFACSLLV